MEKTVEYWIGKIENSTGPEQAQAKNQAYLWARAQGRDKELVAAMRRVAQVARRVECWSEGCYCSHCRGW